MEVPPDTVAYTVVISAYARRGRAKEAEAILKEMLSNEISPNTYTFNAVMDAWSKSGAEDAPEQCRRILDGLKRTSGSIRSQTGERTLEPDAFSYTILMDTYAARGQASEAEGLLKEMLAPGSNAPPNEFTYSAVMKAWINSKAKDAPDQCLRLLREMEQLSQERRRPDLKANRFTYAILFPTFRKHGRLQDLARHFPNMDPRSP